jgi:hypothetical protein
MTRSAMIRTPRLCASSTSWHEVAEVAELRQDLEEVGDVVAAVAQRRLVDRQQPQAVDAEPLQVVHLVGQAADVAGAVAAGVVEAADQHLVEDRALVPVRVVGLEWHVSDLAHGEDVGRLGERVRAGRTAGCRPTCRSRR